MRWNQVFISIAVAITGCLLPSAFAASPFGTVVPLNGQAADIVLDESRGLLYVANFTANRIEVMSTTDNTVHTSINTDNQPGGLAI